MLTRSAEILDDVDVLYVYNGNAAELRWDEEEEKRREEVAELQVEPKTSRMDDGDFLPVVDGRNERPFHLQRASLHRHGRHLSMRCPCIVSYYGERDGMK